MLSQEHVKFAGRELPIEEIEGLSVIRTDTYINGAWVNGTRVIGIRGVNRTLSIDCSQAFPSRNALDNQFADAFDPIWSVVGSRLVARFLSRLANDETVRIGGIGVNRDGILVDGSWRVLWWKARPKLITWSDLRIFSSEGTLFLEFDQRHAIPERSEIQRHRERHRS